MRSVAIKRATGLLLAAGLVVGAASVAAADEFDTDAPAPVTASTTVQVWVQNISGEGPWDTNADGCNINVANDNLTVTASITSNNANVTVNPNTMTFGACGSGASQPLQIVVTQQLCTAVTGTVTIAKRSVTPNANAVKGVFNTETIQVSAPAINPEDSSCNGGPNPPPSTCSEPAAPAWAAALLKATNLKPKQSATNFVSLVAAHMTQGAVFDGVPKSDQGPDTGDDYPTAVRSYMINTLGVHNLATLADARLIRPGWNCTAGSPA